MMVTLDTTRKGSGKAVALVVVKDKQGGESSKVITEK